MRQPPTNRVTYPDRSAESPSEDYLTAVAHLSNRPELEVVGQ